MDKTCGKYQRAAKAMSINQLATHRGKLHRALFRQQLGSKSYRFHMVALTTCGTWEQVTWRPGKPINYTCGADRTR